MDIGERVLAKAREVLKSNPKHKYFEVINIDTEYLSRKDCTVKCLVCGKVHKHYDVSRLFEKNNPGVLNCCKEKYTLLNGLETLKKNYIGKNFKSLDCIDVIVKDVKISSKGAYILIVKNVMSEETSEVSIGKINQGDFYFNKNRKARSRGVESTTEYKWLEEHSWVLCGRPIIKETYKSIRECEVLCECCGKKKLVDLQPVWSHRNSDKYNTPEYVYRCIDCINLEQAMLTKDSFVGVKCTSLDGFKCVVLEYKSADKKNKIAPSVLVAEVNNIKHQRWVAKSNFQSGFNLDVRISINTGETIVNVQGCTCIVNANSRGNRELEFLDGLIVKGKNPRSISSLKYSKINKDGSGKYLGYTLKGYACGDKPIGDNPMDIYYNVYINNQISILRPCDIEEMYKRDNQ